MKRPLALLALTLLVATQPVAAQFAKVGDAVDYRQSVFVVMSYHFGLISKALKGEIPFNAQEVAANANLVQTLSKLPWGAFPAGSTTPDSHAKPEIWKDPEKFKNLQQQLQSQTEKLASAAKGADQAAIKEAFGNAGKTCKECHDTFRSKH